MDETSRMRTVIGVAAVVVVLVVIIVIAASATGNPTGTYVGSVGRAENGTTLTISRDQKELFFTFSGPNGLSEVYRAEQDEGRSYRLIGGTSGDSDASLEAELRRGKVMISGFVLPVGEVSVTYDRNDVE